MNDNDLLKKSAEKAHSRKNDKLNNFFFFQCLNFGKKREKIKKKNIFLCFFRLSKDSFEFSHNLPGIFDKKENFIKKGEHCEKCEVDFQKKRADFQALEKLL